MPHPHAARSHHGHGHKPGSGTGLGMPSMDFDRAPFLVIWETTQACDLACRHCRACAQPLRHPEELSTDEAKQLLTDIRRFGPIIVVFSGGDAMKRPDIIELVAHGSSLGLRMAITPATTPLTSIDMMRGLKDAGLARLAVSLDGSNPAIHDTFRRVDGSFGHGLRILQEAASVGLTTQVNTVVRKANLDDMPAMAELMGQVGIVFWEVFFLVPMGRAKPEDVASAAGFEQVFNQLYDLSLTAPFDIKATAAPQYGRVVLQRKRAETAAAAAAHPSPNRADTVTHADSDGTAGERGDVLTRGAHHSLKDGIGRARNVTDGDGFLFISHTGDIYPSGFLPISAGNIRTHDLVETYRTAPLFTQLRDRSNLKGKCGVCNFRAMCGGSRARAYATMGDPFEAEPYCDYIPPRWRHLVEDGDAEPDEIYFERRMHAHLADHSVFIPLALK